MISNYESEVIKTAWRISYKVHGQILELINESISGNTANKLRIIQRKKKQYLKSKQDAKRNTKRAINNNV